MWPSDISFQCINFSSLTWTYDNSRNKSWENHRCVGMQSDIPIMYSSLWNSHTRLFIMLPCFGEAEIHNSLSYALPLLHDNSNNSYKYELLHVFFWSHKSVKDNSKSNGASHSIQYHLLSRFMWSWHINFFLHSSIK